VGRTFHPQAWLLWALAGMAAALLTRNPLYLLLVLLAVRLAGTATTLPRETASLFRLAWPILALTTGWNLLTVHLGETVLVTLPGWLPLVGGPLTLEAGLWGLTNGLALVALLTLFLTLNSAVSPHELARLTPAFLHEAGLVASVALAFVPQTLRTLREIRDAQAVRGHRVRGPRDLLPLFLPLLITALEKAVQLAEALEARGYGLAAAPPLRERLIAALGLLGLLSGWFVALFWWQHPLTGYLLAAVGVALLGVAFWLMGRHGRRTRYRPHRWTRADWLLAALSLLPLLAVLLTLLLHADRLAYTPYPRAALPPFDPLIGGSLMLLGAPLLLRPQPACDQGREKRAAAGSPVDHPAPCGVTFQRVTFSYPDTPHPVLRDLSLEVPPGAFVLVTGPSGVGKSTLLRCVNGLVPHASGGRFAGRVRVGDMDSRSAGPRRLARRVGFVFQDPEAQFITDRVDEEVAFALENAGLPSDEVQRRVDEVLDWLGLTPLRDRAISTLSGGQMQQVAVAAALALRPAVLVLDEPTSQLDPVGAHQVLDLLARLREEAHITIILAEHRLERVLRYADLLVYFPDPFSPPRVGPPRQVLRDAPLVPPIVALGRALGWEPLPLSVDEGRQRAAETARRFAPAGVRGQPTSSLPEDTSALLRVEGLSYAYNGTAALRGVGFRVQAGELVALIGPNGSGKTTLLKCITGLLKPQEGAIYLDGEEITAQEVATVCRRVGYLPQDPDTLLFAESVAQELRITLTNHNLESRPPVSPERLLDELGLASLATAYPRDLSVGQRGRVALGAVTVTRPRLLLLDEPTRGLDYQAKTDLVRLLRGWLAEGSGVLMVTHDMEMVAQAADRVVRLEQGRVVADGLPGEVLATGDDFSPQIARLFPGAGWLTVEQALSHLE